MAAAKRPEVQKPFEVVVADFIHEPLEIEREILGDIASLRALGAISNAELVGQVESAHAVLVYHFVSFGREQIDTLANCRVIARCGAGYDNIDIGYARKCGIDVTNVPDYGTEDVADTAIAMTLSLARGVHRMSTFCKLGTDNWTYELAIPLRRIRGRVFGVLGLGRIGTAVALRAKALGYDVVFYDPHVGDGNDKALGIRRAEDLGDFLRQSNVVSCHCLLSAETQHLINGNAIEQLPMGSLLINTSRGGVVDPAAVLAGLESGRLAGAALDVLEQEPPSSHAPLMQAWRDPQHPAFSNLMITPHAAFYSQEGLEDMRRKSAQTVRRCLLGQPTRNVVN